MSSGRRNAALTSSQPPYAVLAGYQFDTQEIARSSAPPSAVKKSVERLTMKQTGSEFSPPPFAADEITEQPKFCAEFAPVQ